MSIVSVCFFIFLLFFFQAEDGIRDRNVTGVQTCALPICEISLEKTNTGVLFDSNTLINDNELNINYIYNILNLKKKKSYDEEQQLIIRHSSKEQEILNLDLVINTKVDAKSRILENNKDTIIKSSLTEQEQTNLNDRYINLFNELNNKKE